MKIIDYVVVRTVISERLINKVLGLISKGYVPLGGIAVTNTGYIQALVKYEEAEK